MSITIYEEKYEVLAFVAKSQITQTQVVSNGQHALKFIFENKLYSFNADCTYTTQDVIDGGRVGGVGDSCASPNCSKSSYVGPCPKCDENNLQKQYWCSNECFRGNWETHAHAFCYNKEYIDKYNKGEIADNHIYHDDIRYGYNENDACLTTECYFSEEANTTGDQLFEMFGKDNSIGFLVECSDDVNLTELKWPGHHLLSDGCDVFAILENGNVVASVKSFNYELQYGDGGTCVSYLGDNLIIINSGDVASIVIFRRK